MKNRNKTHLECRLLPIMTCGLKSNAIDAHYLSLQEPEFAFSDKNT